MPTTITSPSQLQSNGDFDFGSTVLNQQVIINVNNSVIRNLKVSGVRNGLQNNNAAIQIRGSGNTIVNPLAEKNSGGGISFLGGQNNKVYNPISRFNGHFGFGGSDCKGCEVFGGEWHENNKGFDNPPWKGQPNTQQIAGGLWQVQAGWEGGAGKWANTDGVLIHGTIVRDNAGVGLWFDINNRNMTIRGVETFRNMWPGGIGAGIAIEISYGPCLIDNCLCRGNAGAGISLWETFAVTIQNCEILAQNGQGYGVEFRNLDRGSWMLKNIKVTGNRFHGVKGGAGPQPYVSVPGSGSKWPFSPAYRQANNIVTDPNTFVAPGTAIAWQRPAIPVFGGTTPPPDEPPPIDPKDKRIAELEEQIARDKIAFENVVVDRDAGLVRETKMRGFIQQALEVK